MGRELKRVPLDFKWPLNERWGGFVNPHYAGHQHECAECGGSGSSPEARLMKDRWYGNAPFKPEDRGSVPFTPEDACVRRFAERNAKHSADFYGYGEAAIQREARRLCALFNGQWMHHLNDDDVAALLAEGRLMDFSHEFKPGEGWQKRVDAPIPTARQVNEWSICGMGHDSINQWIVVGAECKRLGIDPTCPACHGEGSTWSSPEAKQRAEDWESSEPPKGDGYQVWETVSEGSPISPVFATPEELARHMATTRWGADEGASYEQWMKFILGPGWAMSMVADANGLRCGVQAI